MGRAKPALRARRPKQFTIKVLSASRRQSPFSQSRFRNQDDVTGSNPAFNPRSPSTAAGNSPSIKTKSPRPTFRSDRDKSGDGSSPCSLSRAGYSARPIFVRAASFPTLFSTASGVFGLVAGPSSVLRALNFEWGFSACLDWWLRHRPANQVQTRLRILIRVCTS